MSIFNADRMKDARGEKVIFAASIIEGSGIYIEELKKEIFDRDLKMPPFYGLALDDESADMEQIIKDFNVFIKGVCK